MNRQSFFWIIIFGLFYKNSKADFSILINGKRSIFVVEESIFRDNTQKKDICDVIEPSNAQYFYKSTSRSGFMTDPNSNYWLRFSIKNLSGKHLLISRDAIFKEVRLWKELSLDTYFEINRIDKYLKNESLIFQRSKVIFPVDDSPEVSTYYVKFKPGEGQFVGIDVQTLDNYFSINVRDTFLYGFFFGITFIMAVYNLIIYVRSKERIYLHYAFYIINLSLYAAASWYLLPFDRFDRQFFLMSYTIPYSLMTVFLLSYTRIFFATKSNEPIYDKVLIAMIVFKLAVVTSRLSGIQFEFFYSSLVDNLFILFAFGIGIKRYLKGYKPARFYLIGFGIILLGFFSHSITDVFKKYHGYLFNLTLNLNNNLYYAGIAEIIFFSLSLSDRYRILKSEKEYAQQALINQLKENELLKDTINQELEQKVQERTMVISAQAQEIADINDLLQEKNVKLQEDVKSISKDRVMVTQIGFEEFQATYSTDQVCYRFLVDLKWTTEYKCRKCGHKIYSKGTILFSRRCNHCKYIETPTAHTVFHRLRFPIVKAFYIMFLMYSRKEMTIDELSKEIDLRAATCHAFKQKVLLTMKNKKKFKNLTEGWSSFILE